MKALLPVGCVVEAKVKKWMFRNLRFHAFYGDCGIEGGGLKASTYTQSIFKNVGEIMRLLVALCEDTQPKGENSLGPQDIFGLM